MAETRTVTDLASPAGSKWPAKLSTFEDKAPTQSSFSNNSNPASISPFSASTLHRVLYPKLLFLGLNAAFQNNYMRSFFSLQKVKSLCFENCHHKKREKRKRKSAKHSDPVSHSPHTASCLAHTALCDIKGRSASKEPHGLPKGLRTWPSAPTPPAPLRGPTASFTNSALPFHTKSLTATLPQTTLKAYPLYSLWKKLFPFLGAHKTWPILFRN